MTFLARWIDAMAKWSQELIDAVSAAWVTSASASQIAEKYGLTRNAVIGRMARLGVVKPGTARLKPKPKPKPEPKPELEQKAPPAPVIVRPPIPMEECRDDQCPYPMWDDKAPSGGPDYPVCGAPKLRAAWYCDEHLAICSPASVKAKNKTSQESLAWKAW